MRISSFTKTRKIKPFSFTPRYYNQEKEEFQARYAEIEAKINGTTSGASSPTMTGFKDKWKQNKNTSNFERKSNIRLAMIIAVLFGLCYWILFS